MNTPQKTPSYPTMHEIHSLVAEAKAARGREFARLFQTLTARLGRPSNRDFMPGIYTAKLGTTSRYSSAYF